MCLFDGCCGIPWDSQCVGVDCAGGLIQLSIAWGSSRGAFVRDVLLSDLRNLVVTEGCGCWGTGFS